MSLSFNPHLSQHVHQQPKLHVLCLQYNMLCGVCENAFREDCENIDEAVNHLLLSPPKPAAHTAPCSPFYKASHHTLPQLKQYASDGCHLCILLWTAALSKVHNVCNDTLRTACDVHGYPVTSRSIEPIFGARQSPRRLLVKYKYQMILVDVKNYVQPLKRHFRLLWSEGTLFSLVVEQHATFETVIAINISLCWMSNYVLIFQLFYMDPFILTNGLHNGS